MDDWDLLEARKSALLESSRSKILNESVVAYITEHEEAMGYDECRSVLAQLIAGPDGQSREWRIFGGGYKSFAVRGWMELMELYDDKHLDLVELGLKLKKVLSESAEARRCLSECHRNISAISEKIEAARDMYENHIFDLHSYRDDFTAETSPDELEVFARSLSEKNNNKLLSSVRAVLASDAFETLVSKTDLRPPTSDLQAWALVVEELYGMYSTRVFEVSLDKEAPGALAILGPLRSQLAAVACIDIQKDSEEILGKLVSLQKRILKSQARVKSFEETEEALLESNRNISDKLNAFHRLRTELITHLESKLVPYFPKGVVIQLL